MAKITNEMLLQILQAIGGTNNVKQCGNCMTRLRLTLQNEHYVDKAAIKQVDGVLGVIESDQQLQIVLGPGKAQTAAEMMNQLLETASQDDAPITEQNQDLNSLASTNKQQLKQKQTTAVHRFLSKFATIFTPLIPGFIAAGLLLGIATLIKQSVYPQGLPDDPAAHGHLVHLILYMSIFAKGLFSFLGILIGYNAQKLLVAVALTVPLLPQSLCWAITRKSPVAYSPA